MASLFYKIMLSLDGIVYDLVAYVYDIFDFLVGLNLFGNEDYNSIVSRIYLVLGVVMLFVLSYALLRAVINPEDFSKGDTSFKNMAKNIVISLIIIAFLPTVFTVAYNIQSAILNQNTIGKIILGDQANNAVDENNNIRPGKEMAYYTFTSFFHPNEDWCLSEGIDFNNYQGSEGALSACKRRINSNGIWFIGSDKNLEEVDSEILNNNRSFAYYGSFSRSIGSDDGDKISYTWLISTIAGGFLLYVLLNFCFDMALRVIKLMFYQLLAPIPVVCRAIPFGGLKDVFNKWVKNTIHTFLEVFIRIAVMYFAIFLIDLVVHVYVVYDIARSYGLGITQSLLVQALIIMAIVMFIKQAPKLIGDIFGIDSGSMKLGLMDKLAQGGAFAAGNALGAAVTGRSPLAVARAFKYGMKNKDFKAIGQEAIRRRAYKDALSDGATRRQILFDRLRRKMGFESLNAKEEYEINGAKYMVTTSDGEEIPIGGNDVKELERQMEARKTQISILQQSNRDRDIISNNNDLAIKARGAIKSEAESKVDDKNSKVLSSISHGGYTFTGNYHSMSEQLQAALSNGTITSSDFDQLSQKLVSERDNMVANYVDYTTGVKSYDDVQLSGVSFVDGENTSNGNIMTNYTILRNNEQEGMFVDLDGNGITSARDGWNYVKDMYSQAIQVKNDVEIENQHNLNEISQLKAENEAAQNLIDQRKQQQEAARRTTGYIATKSSSDYNDNKNK